MKENFLKYVFEQPEQDQKTQIWEKFVEGLSKETLMSDPKLKSILIKLVKSEAQILNKAADAVESILNKAGGFKAGNRKIKNDGEEVMVNLTINMVDAKKAIPAAIRIENGRPLIFLPDNSREELNDMGSPESKRLSGELMHIQETVLNKMDDILKASANRDKFLEKMESETHKFITDMSPLQIAMVKFILKLKYKGVN